jgi:hypothetical protein
MARSIKGSPFVKKDFPFKDIIDNFKENENNSLVSQLNTSPIVKQLPQSEEFTSPRTIMAESASSLDSSLDLGSSSTMNDPSETRRRSARMRKSTLLATLVASNKDYLKRDILASETEIIKEQVERLSTQDSEKSPISNNELYIFCTGDQTVTVRAKVESILIDIEAKPEETLLGLLNCILAFSGVCATLVSDDLEVDDPAEVLGKILNDEKLIVPPEHNLLGKKVSKFAYKRFYELFKGIGSSGMGIDQIVSLVVSDLIPWLTCMSSVSLRSLRIASTIAALTLVTGSCDCARGFQRSIESSKRISKKVSDHSAKVASIEQVMQTIFDHIFIQRYRDICEDIRCFAIEQLVTWMEGYPGVFIDNLYLRYLGWSLGDASGHVRAEALTGLHKIYLTEGTSLVSFTERFQERLLHVVERDSVNKNRALEVLDLAASKGLITRLNLAELCISAINGDITGIDWKRAKNIALLGLGDSSQLLTNLTANLSLENWKNWEQGLEEFANVFDISNDPVVEVYQNPLAIFWLKKKITRRDFEELFNNNTVKNEVFFSRIAGYMSEHSELVDPDQVTAFYMKVSRCKAEEACKRLLPVIQQYSLAPSIMRLLANDASHAVGILTLSSLVEPPNLTFPDELNDNWIATAQVEYRRILWLLKNADPNAKAVLQELFKKISLQTLFKAFPSPDSLASVLALWTDLLLLGRKRFDSDFLEFSETEVDIAVRKAAQLKNHDLEAKLGLSIGKLLIANILSPQAALRDLCALAGDFEEYQELVQLAINQCLVLGPQSLSSKLNLARGILQIRPALGKPIIMGIKSALKSQVDESALVQFLETLAGTAGSDLWSLINTHLLKDLSPEVRAKVLQFRTAPTGTAGRKRKESLKRSANNQEDTLEEVLLSASGTSRPESDIGDDFPKQKSHEKENFMESSPAKKIKRQMPRRAAAATRKTYAESDEEEETVVYKL